MTRKNSKELPVHNTCLEKWYNAQLCIKLGLKKGISESIFLLTVWVSGRFEWL